MGHTRTNARPLTHITLQEGKKFTPMRKAPAQRQGLCLGFLCGDRSEGGFLLGLVGQDNRFGHILHGLARIHAHFLDAAERFGL